jgi:hypothetical protein
MPATQARCLQRKLDISEVLRNQIIGLAGCCARTANGQLAVPPLIAAMTARRFSPL